MRDSVSTASKLHDGFATCGAGLSVKDRHQRNESRWVWSLTHLQR